MFIVIFYEYDFLFKAQLEHQATRINNLELMSDFGVNAWKNYNAVLEKQLKHHEKGLNDIR